MCIVQIRELVSQLSDEVKQQNPAIPWRVIKDTRNFYVHAYGAIDISSVWDTLNHDIPDLKSACEAILSACPWLTVHGAAAEGHLRGLRENQRENLRKTQSKNPVAIAATGFFSAG